MRSDLLFKRHIGYMLWEAREDLGLTVAELADHIGMDASLLIQYEQSGLGLKSPFRKKLESELGMDIRKEWEEWTNKR